MRRKTHPYIVSTICVSLLLPSVATLVTTTTLFILCIAISTRQRTNWIFTKRKKYIYEANIIIIFH